MAAVSAELKRLVLRNAKWDAEDEGATLYDKLKSLARGKYEESSSGSQIVSTSANGKTVTFGLPSNSSGWTSTTTAELSEELFRRFVETATYLGAATDGSADAAIHAQMLTDIQPIRSFTREYRSLRCA